MSAAASGAACAQGEQDLRSLSIEQLSNVEVTTVTKTAEPLGAASAAVYVITCDAIARSAAHTVPEALRLAPNLYVAQTNANRYVITARGLSGNEQAQNFSNKLLVLI